MLFTVILVPIYCAQHESLPATVDDKRTQEEEVSTATMQVVRYRDAAAILEAAADFFVEDELNTTLPSGVFKRLKHKPDLFGDPAKNYFLLVVTATPLPERPDTAAGTRPTASLHTCMA
jgi:hypothetical protein